MEAVYTDSSTLFIELGGTQPGDEFDRVAATGTVALNGTLRVEFIDLRNGYAPRAGDSFEIISAAEAKMLIAKGMPVYDVRADEEYKNAHVPSAVSVPYKEGSAKEVDFDRGDDQFALNKLPKDKNAPFMMYCDGTVCWKSYKSAVMAIEAGWKNVYWFRGGFEEWKHKGYPFLQM